MLLLQRKTEALIRRFSAIDDVSDQSSEAQGNEWKNSKIVSKRHCQGKSQEVVMEEQCGEFRLGNSLMQAAENINKDVEEFELEPSVVGLRQPCERARRVLQPAAGEAWNCQGRREGVDGERQILSIRGEHREEEEESGSGDGGWMAESYGYYDTAVMLPEIMAELKDGVLIKE